MIEREAPTRGEEDLVQLDRDHPGFRDLVYRERRNHIARMALQWRFGEPFPRAHYTDVEHSVWRTSIEAMRPLHAKYACKSYREGWPALNFDPDRIPEFDELNPILNASSGFSLLPVAGLVDARVFMGELSRDTFLATQYVRHHSVPLYTPEPDVIHELIGHAPMLVSRKIAEVNRLFGAAAHVVGPEDLKALVNVYWYGIEFGVVEGEKSVEVIGAGLLSSFGELGRFEKEAQLRPFVLEEVARTGYDPTQYQATLFVARSEQAFLDDMRRWLEGLIEAAQRGEIR
jgi:phenylalanine-4-hydroxylase